MSDNRKPKHIAVFFELLEVKIMTQREEKDVGPVR